MSGKRSYADSFRMEPKRGHQWLTDSSNLELFSNKTRAVECADVRLGMGAPQINLSGWDNSVASGQWMNHLYVPKNVHTANLVAGNLPFVDGQCVEGRQYLEEQYNNASSFGLFHNLQDGFPSYGLGGIRKVKVNQANDFTRSIQEPMMQFYGEGIPRSFDMGYSFSRGQNNPISLGQTASSSDKSYSFAGPIFNTAGGSFPQNFSKDGISFTPMSSFYGKGDANVLPTGLPFNKGGDNFVQMGQSFQKMDSNPFSMNPSYKSGRESFMSILTSYGKEAENLCSSDTYFQKEANVLAMGSSPHTAGSEMAYKLPNQDNQDQNNVPIPQQGGSFGGFQNENALVSSGSITNGYESVGSVAQTSKDPIQKKKQKNSAGHNANPNADTIPKIKKPKTNKKVPTETTFPTNVKSLLSTGMLDGVPVKYYSWSREKSLYGIIKGVGYLCGCSECKMSKVLNAYEFERHANCKTKHPNNHIYFENGRSVYAIVQELKNTPQEKLFDVIQDVTGSEINLENFNTWKASYQAASRELQRIYGADGVNLTS